LRLLFQIMAGRQASDTVSWKRYEYTQLSSARSIRLLRWEQCAEVDAVDRVYQLIQVSLENAPPYEALSYAWGSLDFRPGVKIEDGYIFVTVNCFDALQHLPRTTRKDGKVRVSWFEAQARYIWIDAICINQEDIEERNQQVSIMPEIYRKAERVLVWLEKTSIDPNLPLDIHAGVMSEAFEINNIEMDRWKNPRLVSPQQSLALG
jgi:Heterokaryon incompatibility protein (HET)